jgi:hypothetical protein
MSRQQKYTLDEVMALYDLLPIPRDMQPNPFIVEEPLYPLYSNRPMRDICGPAPLPAAARRVAADPKCPPDFEPKQAGPAATVADTPKPKAQFVPPPVFDSDPLIPWGIVAKNPQPFIGFTPPPISENRQSGRLRDRPADFAPWNIAIPLGLAGAF